MRRHTPPRITPPRDLRRHTEAAWQRLLTDTASTFGWVWLHIRDSRGEQEGVPDLMLWRGDQYLLVEVKTERGKLRPEQIAWHARAAIDGVTVHIWRPSDWRKAAETLTQGYDVEIDE